METRLDRKGRRKCDREEAKMETERAEKVEKGVFWQKFGLKQREMVEKGRGMVERKIDEVKEKANELE